MKHFTDPYSPSEVATVDELLIWIRFRRNALGIGNSQSKRIISRDINKMREVHKAPSNALLNVGFTGNQYSHNKVYIWYGFKNSRTMYNADWDID